MNTIYQIYQLFSIISCRFYNEAMISVLCRFFLIQFVLLLLDGKLNKMNIKVAIWENFDKIVRCLLEILCNEKLNLQY